VSFEVGPDALGLWDENMNRVVEPGVFDLTVGTSSTEGQKAELRVERR
jgi:hypothetical protein